MLILLRLCYEKAKQRSYSNPKIEILLSHFKSYSFGKDRNKKHYPSFIKLEMKQTYICLTKDR